ncbi:MAG: transporter substrate-binding domain-containing protein [Clostridioides sp.]|nr:transporter substrate-binding domain-containing protein [Clostridioides sp.]
MKITKKVLGLVMGMIMAVGVVGCSSKTNESSNSSSSGKTKIEEIKEKGKVIVGLSAEYPPYEFVTMKDGKDEIVGVDIEIAKEIAKDLGVELEITNMDFDGLIGALNADKIDMIISAMSPTEERKETTDFSDIYYASTNAIVVKEGFDGKIETKDDLKNYTVGVQRGSIQEQYVSGELGLTKVKSLVSVTDLSLDLQNSNADLVIVNDNVAKNLVTQFKGLKVLDTTVGAEVQEETAVGIKKTDKNKEFLDSINKTIKKLKDADQIAKYLEEATELAGKQQNQ